MYMYTCKHICRKIVSRWWLVFCHIIMSYCTKKLHEAGKIFCTTAEMNYYKSCVNHTHCSLHITKPTLNFVQPTEVFWQPQLFHKNMMDRRSNTNHWNVFYGVDGGDKTRQLFANFGKKKSTWDMRASFSQDIEGVENHACLGVHS